jgi:homoserine kinase
MACSSAYAACITRRSCVTLWVQALAIPCGRANGRRLPSGLGGSGQSAFAGLYSLSNHCSAEINKLKRGE